MLQAGRSGVRFPMMSLDFQVISFFRPYYGNRHKLFNLMKIYMFAILDRAKADKENTRRFNLAAVGRTAPFK
jgi:hypothetical protein